MSIKVKIGDIVEDCAYHPVLVLEKTGDDIVGISLLDGSEPRSCSIKNCIGKKLMPEDVAIIMRNKELYVAAEEAWRASEGTNFHAYDSVHDIRDNFYK